MTTPTPPSAGSALRLLVIAGTVELVALATLGWWDGATFPWVAPALYAIAFVAYAVAGMRVLSTDGGHLSIWVFAILMRLVLLPLAPELSADIYRYLWDGEVQLAGINPYRYAPNALELSQIIAPYNGMILEPQLPTPYPPLAQGAFLIIAMAGGAVLQAKLLFLGLDLGTGWLLGRVSVITGRSRRLTQLLYLWSPLLLVEVGWNGHLAPLGLFTLVLIILLARAPTGAGAATALASLTGLAPALAVPAATRRLGSKFLVGFVIATVIFAAPYAVVGQPLIDALRAVLERPTFMQGPYALFEAVLPGELGPRVAVGMLITATVIWTTVQRYRPERALFWVLGAFFILAPALRPWYVLWMLPLAALRANRTWLLLTGLVFLQYVGLPEYQETGVWPEPAWVQILIWLPFLALLGRDADHLWRERVPPPKPLSEPVQG